MKPITKQWIEAAELDLENIKLILVNDRLTGHVAFHAQQAIEKSAKAILEEFNHSSQKIHSLQKLFKLVSSHIKIEIDEDIIIALDSLYTESRYPGELGLMPYGQPDTKEAQLYYEYAKKVHSQILTFLTKS